MNTLVLLLISIAVLFCGYVFYGSWIARQWGVNEGNRPTPAHTMEDGVDYVPAKAPILMGHHFSSIAGAGPITGPIGAAMFGCRSPSGYWWAVFSSAVSMTSAHFSLLSAIRVNPSVKSSP